jgi:hypothetical protein
MLEQQHSVADQELQITLANIAAAARVEVARIGAGIDDGGVLLAQEAKDAHYELMGQLQNMVAVLAAPKTVVRDAQGKVSGVQRTLQ